MSLAYTENPRNFTNRQMMKSILWVRLSHLLLGRSSRNLLFGKCCKVRAHPLLVLGVCTCQCIPLLFCQQLIKIAEMIPSINRIMVFISLNITLIVFFDVFIFEMIVNLTHERFNGIFTKNPYKISMLVSVFLPTVFPVNLLIFTLLLEKGFQKSIFNTVRVSIRTFWLE